MKNNNLVYIAVEYLHPHPNNPRKDLGEKALEIMRVIKQGKLSMAEIARKYGVSRQYVYQLKERLEKE